MTSTRYDLCFSIASLFDVQMLTLPQSITSLLQSAGLAIQTLTAAKSSPTSTPVPASSPAFRRAAFTGATDTYLAALHSVDVRLKRQIKGLHEAKIIAAEPYEEEEIEKSKNKLLETKKNPELDIGYLNTRSNKVARDKEAELWAQARKFLEGLDGITGEQGQNRSAGGKDEEMVDAH
jgi:hypothetical protein